MGEVICEVYTSHDEKQRLCVHFNNHRTHMF